MDFTIGKSNNVSSFGTSYIGTFTGGWGGGNYSTITSQLATAGGGGGTYYAYGTNSYQWQSATLYGQDISQPVEFTKKEETEKDMLVNVLRSKLHDKYGKVM